MPGNDDMMDKVQSYQNVVLVYERLNGEINQLLTANNGATENMTKEDVARYRELARQRDEALNEMRILEKQLLDEDTNSTGRFNKK